MKLKQPNLISEHHSSVTKCIVDAAAAVVCSDARTHMCDVNEPNDFFYQFLGLKTYNNKKQHFEQKEHDFSRINYPFISTDYGHWEGTVLFSYLQFCGIENE